MKYLLICAGIAMVALAARQFHHPAGPKTVGGTSGKIPAAPVCEAPINPPGPSGQG